MTNDERRIQEAKADLKRVKADIKAQHVAGWGDSDTTQALERRKKELKDFLKPHQ